MWAASKGADEAIATWVRHNPDLRHIDKNGGTGEIVLKQILNLCWALNGFSVHFLSLEQNLLEKLVLEIFLCRLYLICTHFAADCNVHCQNWLAKSVNTLISAAPLCSFSTGLHAAALSGHASTVRLLLEHGSDIDAQDLLMHTPLFRACEMGHTDVVQALIDGGAQVEVIDQDGRSPLHWSVVLPSMSIVLNDDVPFYVPWKSSELVICKFGSYRPSAVAPKSG